MLNELIEKAGNDKKEGKGEIKWMISSNSPFPSADSNSNQDGNGKCDGS